MNGPQHYREAERLVASTFAFATALPPKAPANEWQSANDAIRNGYLLANVHATLALAAATAKPLTKDEPEGVEGGNEPRNWFEVLRP